MVHQKNDLKTFYCCVIRSTLEYGAQVWNGNLTQAQRSDIERVQKRQLFLNMSLIVRFKNAD